MVLEKAVGKGRTNTRRVDVLNLWTSPIDLPEVLLVVGAMDMVAPHLSRKEICLLKSIIRRILRLRLKINCLGEISVKN